jgi:hypothetical protein
MRRRPGRHEFALAAAVTTTAAVAAAATGCAQLFGLDETTALPPVVSFTVKRYAVGSQLVVEPMDLTGGTATYLVADPTDASGFRTVPTTSTQLGQWQGDVALGVDTQLRFTLPGETGLTRHFALAPRTVRGLYGYLGKITSTPAPPGATLRFSVSLEKAYEAVERLQWLTSGAWTQHDFAGAELPIAGATSLSPPPIAFTSSSSLSGRPHEKLTGEDGLFVLRHNATNPAAAVLTGVFTAAPFELTGAENPVSGAMQTVTADQSLAVRLDTTGPVDRMANAKPALAAPQYNWSITAAPGFAAGIATGPALAYGSMPVSMGVLPLIIGYGNPFAGRNWPATFVWAATSRRTYQQPAGLPAVALSAAQIVVTQVPTASNQLDFTACMPTSVSVQGATLISDGLTVTIDRTRPVSISMVVDRAEADLYGITLFEVVNTGATATLTPRFQSLNQKSVWSLPGDIFETGKIYTVRASCSRGGHPGLGTGDLERRELPIASAYLDSGVFTVTQ